LIVLIERIAKWSAADAALAVNPAMREVPLMKTFGESGRGLLLGSEEVLPADGAWA
jgi:hypothetical protein